MVINHFCEAISNERRCRNSCEAGSLKIIDFVIFKKKSNKEYNMCDAHLLFIDYHLMPYIFANNNI